MGLHGRLKEREREEDRNKRVYEEFGTLATTVEFSLGSIRGGGKELLEVALERAKEVLAEGAP